MQHPRPRALFFMLLLGGCDAPWIENTRASLFLFQTRNEAGGVPLASDAPSTPLYLEPVEPDTIQGRSGPLLRPDRTGPITLGEWMAAGGDVKVRCQGEITEIDASLTSLVPHGVYTAWVIATVIPLRYGGDGQPTYLVTRDFLDRRFIVTLEPAGAPDGSDSAFSADAQGNARFHASVAALVSGQTGCLTSTSYWHVVFDYHADGNTYGPLARPSSGTTEQAAHLGFIFSGGTTPEQVLPP